MCFLIVSNNHSGLGLESKPSKMSLETSYMEQKTIL